MGRRQRRRERETGTAPVPEGGEVPVRIDCTVTAGVATASGIVAPDPENED